jgi:hypothetical protein
MKRIVRVLIGYFALIVLASGCSVVNPFSDTSHIKESEKFMIPKLEENEPDPTYLLKESYEEAERLSLQGYDVTAMRDPFMPVFSAAEQLSEAVSEDELRLRNIYSEDDIKYADIELGGIIYKVTEGYEFAEYYVVNTIGATYIDVFEGDSLTRVYLKSD